MAFQMTTTPQRIEVVVDVPLGHTVTHYRYPEEGEMYLSTEIGARVMTALDNNPLRGPKFILTKDTVYREPAMPQDYNKMIEVCDNNTDNSWVPVRFMGFREGQDYPFLGATEWRFGRIEV